jgi:carbonic anhydrase
MWQQKQPLQYDATGKNKQDPYSKWGAIGTWIILLFVVIAFPIGILVYTKLHPAEEKVPKWHYGLGQSGPADWGSVNANCNGKQQSPINISPTANSYLSTKSSMQANKISEYAKPAQLGTYLVEQSHGAPKYSCRGTGTACGTLTVDGQDYNLLQFHFHAPSENTVDGHAYPLAMHMVHQNPTTKALAVVTTLFESTTSEDATNTGNAAAVIDKLWTQIAADGASTQNIDLTEFIDLTSGYYRWTGSLTTPPCSEGVEWFVQATPKSVKASQIETYWNHIGGYPGNARPTQSLHGRTITYSVDRN